jgi:hypothetical protein
MLSTKKAYLLLLGLTSSVLLNAQIKAVTETGDTIYVYNNGTWSYELEEINDEFNELDFLKLKLDIDTLEKKIVAPSNAQTEVKIESNGILIKYDSKKWKRVPPANLNNEADLAFESKTESIWCIVIAEETFIPSDNLFRIAKRTMEQNLKAQVEILKTEYVNVNGINVLRGAVKADVAGIVFVFDSYYYSSPLGSVQFTTWTSENLWRKNQTEIAELLSGFIIENEGR